ncbi:MAG: hypothetical protein M1818_007257 [Claussenomyces sp. TS43310]|nr:MAG: hypothetical protein M1818_007257 [Claussenomyces sp. TS43310]
MPSKKDQNATASHPAASICTEIVLIPGALFPVSLEDFVEVRARIDSLEEANQPESEPDKDPQLSILDPDCLKLFDDLTAAFPQPSINRIVEVEGIGLFEGPHGSNANVSTVMSAIYFVVRTGPSISWKGAFIMGAHMTYISNVSV